MADSFSKHASTGFLHSSHRRFSRQVCRKASQTIHISAIMQSLYTSLLARFDIRPVSKTKLADQVISRESFLYFLGAIKKKKALF